VLPLTTTRPPLAEYNKGSQEAQLYRARRLGEMTPEEAMQAYDGPSPRLSVRKSRADFGRVVLRFARSARRRNPCRAAVPDSENDAAFDAFPPAWLLFLLPALIFVAVF